MLIEDFIRFDKEELTFNKLIFQYYPKYVRRKIIVSISFGFLLATSSLVSSLLKEKWIGVLPFLAGVTLVLTTIKYSHRKTHDVIIEKYEGTLKAGEKWETSTIEAIRVQKIKSFTLSRNFYKSVEPVIQALLYDSSKPTYSFKSLGVILNFISTVAGSYLGVLFALTKGVTEMNELLVDVIVAIMLVGMGFFAVESIVKKRIDEINSKHSRLIRTLQNYSMNQE